MYWIPLFQVLESHVFEVKLVNAKHVENVPGRKSDVQMDSTTTQLRVTPMVI